MGPKQVNNRPPRLGHELSHRVMIGEAQGRLFDSRQTVILQNGGAEIQLAWKRPLASDSLRLSSIRAARTPSTFAAGHAV